VAPSQGTRQYGAPTAPAPSPFGGGGFLRSLAGGLVGGMLGGMLFRSLGFAGGAGGMGGGIGLLDILLIGALLYGLYWFFMKRRRETPAEATAGPYYRESQPGSFGQTQAAATAYEPASPIGDREIGLAHLRQMDPSFDEKRFTDGCLDRFFAIQGAWANRDMAGVRNLLTDEIYGMLSVDARQLKDKKQINRLENIAVRTVEITEVWQEKGEDFITVKIYANLLDFTVDERSGEVLSGSRTEPVKFNEYWTFTRPVGNNPWRLSAIQQAE
jgi:predicted lipid-binding transport protein (Tim44 family)